MTTMMRDLPHLPLLSMPQCVEIFRACGVPKLTLSVLSGFTRMQIHRWMLGQYAKPHRATQESVSTLAYKILRAAKSRSLPPPKARYALRDWAAALDDRTHPPPLHQWSAEDLLPPAWCAKFNLEQSTKDATA